MTAARSVLGVVTIGQSPRPDMSGDLEFLLGGDVCLEEAGALDGLSPADVVALSPGSDDVVLVTRLAGGQGVKVSEARIQPLLQTALDRLFDQGIQTILLLCTGSFSLDTSRGLVIRPDGLLLSTAAALAGGQRLGVLFPQPEQINWMRPRWQAVAADVCLEAAAPHGPPEELVRAAQSLKAQGATLLVLDCMGYTLATRAAIKTQVDLPVLLARSLAARVARELL